MCCPNLDSAFMCFCTQVSHGEMIKCDAPKVLHRTCFRFLSQHTDCVGAVVQGRLVPSGLCRPQQGTQRHLVCCLVVMRSNASILMGFLQVLSAVHSTAWPQEVIQGGGVQIAFCVVFCWNRYCSLASQTTEDGALLSIRAVVSVLCNQQHQNYK
jgi:hypothetical protein